jgi:hypothetical protein
MGSTASPDSDIFRHDTPHLRAAYDRKDPATIMMVSGMTRVLSDLRCDRPGGTAQHGTAGAMPLLACNREAWGGDGYERFWPAPIGQPV